VFFSDGAGLPGSSSFDGGLEEFPELRDNRCSSRASFPDSASLDSISSESCPAIAVICPAWRRTTTISSSRDISSSPDTRRSNRTPADHNVIDTHISPTAASAHHRQRVSPSQPTG
jgi:hypothetical protein